MGDPELTFYSNECTTITQAHPNENNQDVVSTRFTTCTVLGTSEPKFPTINVGDSVETELFIQASKNVLPLIECLGKSFSLVHKDVAGNVKKISHHYEKDHEKYATLDRIVSESQSNTKKGMSEGALGILWLNRALDFFRCLLNELVNDHENGVKDESLLTLLSMAYEASLKCHHSFFTQLFIKGVLKMAPSRRTFLDHVKLSPEVSDDVLFSDMKLYVAGMGATVDAVLHLINRTVTPPA